MARLLTTWTLHHVSVGEDGTCSAQIAPSGLPAPGAPCLEISGKADLFLEFGQCFDPDASTKIIKAYQELITKEHRKPKL